MDRVDLRFFALLMAPHMMRLRARAACAFLGFLYEYFFQRQSSQDQLHKKTRPLERDRVKLENTKERTTR